MTRPFRWFSHRVEDWARRPELRRRCAWLHHGRIHTDRPNTSLWRDDDLRPMVSSPQTVMHRAVASLPPSDSELDIKSPIQEEGRRDDHGDRAVAGEDCPPRGRRPFGTPEVEAMSQAVSLSGSGLWPRAGRPLLECFPGNLYRHQQAPVVPKRRPGPVGPCDDATLLEHTSRRPSPRAVSPARSTARFGPLCAFPASAARPDGCGGRCGRNGLLAPHRVVSGRTKRTTAPPRPWTSCGAPI